MATIFSFRSEDFVTPELKARAAALTDRRSLMAALGKRLEVELRAWFRSRNAEPNKQGWPSQNFWDRIRNATALTEFDNVHATVAVADPAFNQKVYGGTIHAKKGKALAIPAVPEAAGVSPLTMNNLRLVVFKDSNRAALVSNIATNITIQRNGKIKARSSTISRVIYWLVKSVTQSADPRALPPMPELFAALNAEATSWFKRNLRLTA